MMSVAERLLLHLMALVSAEPGECPGLDVTG